MLTFIKILSYELRPQSGNVFEHVAKVASQEIDPQSLQKGELIVPVDVILHSTLRRAVDCLKRLPHIQYISMAELKEIPFDLKMMCTESEWSTYGSVIVRKKFKEMFRNDTLLVPREQLFDEVRIVLDRCRQLSTQDVAVISHSFRMKIIEAFIKTNGEIEKRPELIESFISDTEKTYEFGKGFEVDLSKETVNTKL